jgi:aminopeptidase N
VLLLLLHAALQVPAAASSDSAPPIHDALSYEITLVPGDSSLHLLGEVQTTWRLRSAEPVAPRLDTAMRVVRVLVDGRPNNRLSRTVYGRAGEDVVVPHEKREGDSITTRIRYHGLVHEGVRIGPNQYGDRTVFGRSRPDLGWYWFPVQKLPADRATVAFAVQAPLGRQVIGPGALEKIDTLPYGHATWHYRLDTPVPLSSLAFGVARFAIATLPREPCGRDCPQVSLWTFPQDSAYALSGPFRRAGAMAAYFGRTVGPLPFDRLAHVETTLSGPATDNATAIFYDQARFRARTLSEDEVARGTASQWFGIAVSEGDARQRWLSDGLAGYLAVLWREHVDGPRALGELMRRAADSAVASSAISRPVIDTALGGADSATDPRSLWILHQLRGVMGDSAFVTGLRRYFRAFRGRTALAADVARAMSQAAGRDLDWYFRQALTQPGYPILDVIPSTHGGRLVLTVRQVQPPEWGRYRLPGLGLLLDGRLVRVDVDGPETQVQVPGISRKPRRIEVDPAGWWLARMRGQGADVGR